VRVLTFACVIAVHALSHTNSGASTRSATAGMLLHFTREAFFVLTGFVLFHTHYRKPLAVQAFWRKRLTLVGIPYLLWTLIYNVNAATPHPEEASWWQHFGYEVLTGRACYHLYFLLVSLQIYLLMPALLWVVRRAEGHHGLLFGAAAGLEVAITFGLHDVVGNAPLAGVPGILANHSDTLLPSYLLYVVAGALAAVHLLQWQSWVDRHLRLIGGGFVVVLAFTIWAHDAQVHGPATIGYATQVLQPAMIPWSLAAVVALYALGSVWARRQSTGAVGRRTELALQKASHASFGVYLVHPLFLDFLSDHGFGLPHSFLPPPWSAIVLVVVVGLLSFAVVEAMSRTPLSLALTGRPRRKPEKRAKTATEGVVVT
jgi:peptidoglycan/LPS O-acetylase OafA/YrhL